MSNWDGDDYYVIDLTVFNPPTYVISDRITLNKKNSLINNKDAQEGVKFKVITFSSTGLLKV